MRCRIGIATGMVIVGDPAGIGALRSQRLVGDAPNLAARLLVSAQPNTVAIDPATRRLIGDLFDCRELGSIETADASSPIRNWQVLAESSVESRLEAMHGPALIPLVGRELKPICCRAAGRAQKPGTARSCWFRVNLGSASRESSPLWMSA